VTRDRLTAYLDSRLGIADFPNDASANGLQFEGAETVRRVAVAVDACRDTFRRAARAKAEMLIVHHGLLWGPIPGIRGSLKERFRLLFENDISLYACHLPLDAHPVLGNNALLLKELSLAKKGPFGAYHGKTIGWWGRAARSVSLQRFTARIERRLKTRCTVLPFGPEKIRDVGVVSGGGGSTLFEAESMGLDTVLTGEPSHPLYTFAEEVGLNVIFAGHYATETRGVRAVGEELKRKFRLPVTFIDHPTGL